MASIRDMLLTRKKTRAVPLGDATAFVRVMSGAEFNALNDRLDAMKDAPNRNVESMVAVVNASACDDSGQRLFTDAEIELTRQIQLDDLKALMDAAVDLNGMGEGGKASPPKSDSSSG